MSIDFTLKPVDDKKVRRPRRKREAKAQEEDVSQSKLVEKVEGPITREELGSWLWGARARLQGLVMSERGVLPDPGEWPPFVGEGREDRAGGEAPAETSVEGGTQEPAGALFDPRS